MKKNVRQIVIADLLHTGGENGLTLRELVQVTGQDERTIRRKIQSERKAGRIICSDNRHGYFLPESELDVRRLKVPPVKRDRCGISSGRGRAFTDDRARNCGGVVKWRRGVCFRWM